MTLLRAAFIGLLAATVAATLPTSRPLAGLAAVALAIAGAAWITRREQP